MLTSETDQSESRAGEERELELKAGSGVTLQRSRYSVSLKSHILFSPAEGENLRKQKAKIAGCLWTTQKKKVSGCQDQVWCGGVVVCGLWWRHLSSLTCCCSRLINTSRDRSLRDASLKAHRCLTVWLWLFTPHQAQIWVFVSYFYLNRLFIVSLWATFTEQIQKKASIQDI